MIAIVTEIPRFYYCAAEELKKRGLEFLSLDLEMPLPPGVKVVLTTNGERKKIKFKEVVVGEDIASAVDECVKMLKGFETRYKMLVIGIDPGLTPGIAVLGDGKVVLTEGLSSPEDVPDAVAKILRMYSGDEVLFRVGKGGGIYNMRILKALQENFRFKIETVDENKTTPINGLAEPALKDIIAAINIAVKEGETLKKKIRLHPTQGEIKNLQKKSRVLSGTITISKELAEKVAKGELSLEEAIEAQRRK